MAKKISSRMVNLDVIIHVVAKINDGIDIGEFLKKETDWLAEPKTSNGCVVSINVKDFKELEKHNIKRLDVGNDG